MLFPVANAAADPSPRDLELAGTSPAVVRLRENVERVAGTPRTTVLITGELGVDKEEVARRIHARSTGPRAAEGPFVVVRCADPDAVLDNAAARGGTLYLEQVGLLLPRVQEALLELLQRPGKADLREDLLYRLNVLTVRVPPLRERRADVLHLSGFILAQVSLELGLAPAGFAQGALDTLLAHDWPGNTRELRNAIERAALRARGARIGPEELDLETISVGSVAALAAGRADVELVPGPDRSLRGLEERWIRRVLRETEGNRSRAARLLGINRTTLYNKLRLYEIA
ncbi:MAG: sigma 54-interacting transcriptional regulator [Planctomycetota bacterium]|nr:sigma 54-interacting transcriptional regulator [Planctomycetota bacterium]